MGETPLTGLLERDRWECDLENKPCFLSIGLKGLVLKLEQSNGQVLALNGRLHIN